jgi:hypothetical protein
MFGFKALRRDFIDLSMVLPFETILTLQTSGESLGFKDDPLSLPACHGAATACSSPGQIHSG